MVTAGTADDDHGATALAVDGGCRRWRRRRRAWIETTVAALAACGGSGGCSEQPDRREGATAASAAGGVTEVHEAVSWVNLISQAQPILVKRSKEETQKWRLGAIPVSPSFPVFLFPDSTPF